MKYFCKPYTFSYKFGVHFVEHLKHHIMVTNCYSVCLQEAWYAFHTNKEFSSKFLHALVVGQVKGGTCDTVSAIAIQPGFSSELMPDSRVWSVRESLRSVHM